MALKQEDIQEFLATDEAAAMSNREIADKFGCGEATVRRAKQLYETKKLMEATPVSADATQQEERDALFLDMLRADKAELDLEMQISDLKDELKALKDALADAVDHRRQLGFEGRKSMPLFDQIEIKRIADDVSKAVGSKVEVEIRPNAPRIAHTG